MRFEGGDVPDSLPVRILGKRLRRSKIGEVNGCGPIKVSALPTRSPTFVWVSDRRVRLSSDGHAPGLDVGCARISESSRAADELPTSAGEGTYYARVKQNAGGAGARKG